MSEGKRKLQALARVDTAGLFESLEENTKRPSERLRRCHGNKQVKTKVVAGNIRSQLSAVQPTTTGRTKTRNKTSVTLLLHWCSACVCSTTGKHIRLLLASSVDVAGQRRSPPLTAGTRKLCNTKEFLFRSAALLHLVHTPHQPIL